MNCACIVKGVADSFDNEAVAVWALIQTFYLWVKAVNTGSILWSVACALQYFYMVLSWGGYAFIINLIPVFVLGTMFINRFNWKIYIAYSIFYTVGTILSLTITFVNYQVMRSSEHLVSHITFPAMNVYVVIKWIYSHLDEKQIGIIMKFVKWGLVLVFLMIPIFLTASGSTKISTRIMMLIDPSYA